MNLGHIIYIGDNKNKYFSNFKKEIKSFIDIQGVKLVFWDENKILKLIKENFTEKELNAFNILKPNAYKADLARFFILYIYGGWYSDFGLTFLKQIKEYDAETIFFYDLPAQNSHKYPCTKSIQNSLIYSKEPKNKVIKSIIDYLVDRVNNKEYGNCHLDVAGPCAIYKSFKNIKLSDKNKIYEMSNMEDGIEFYGKFLSSVYKINGENFVVFKNNKKNYNLKTIGNLNSNYLNLWNKKNIYY